MVLPKGRVLFILLPSYTDICNNDIDMVLGAMSWRCYYMWQHCINLMSYLMTMLTLWVERWWLVPWPCLLSPIKRNGRSSLSRWTQVVRWWGPFCTRLQDKSIIPTSLELYYARTPWPWPCPSLHSCMEPNAFSYLSLDTPMGSTATPNCAHHIVVLPLSIVILPRSALPTRDPTF